MTLHEACTLAKDEGYLWLAMDEDGYVTAYMDEPISDLSFGEWILTDDGTYSEMHIQLSTPLGCSWDKALVNLGEIQTT